MTPTQKLIAELRAGIPSIQIDGYGAQPDCDMAYITMSRAADMLEAQAAALVPFATLADEHCLAPAYAGDWMTLNIGLMNGNVTQSVIYSKLKVADVRRAKSAIATLTTGEPTNE